MKIRDEQQNEINPPSESAAYSYWILYDGIYISASRPSNIRCQTDGKEFSLILPAGEIIEDPIYLLHFTTQSMQYKTQVIAEEGAHAKVIESYFQFRTCSISNPPAQTEVKTETEILVKKGAILDHILWMVSFQPTDASTKNSIATHTQIEQAEKSQYRNALFAVGYPEQNSTLQLNLSGKQAQAEIAAVFLPKQAQHSNFSCLIEHLQPQCHSKISARSVVEAYAKFKFSGKIKVHEDATQTVAKLESKNILLNPNAEVQTQPELEIYHDDLNCSHGATIGHLDEDAIFYLKSRGIPEQQARAMLVKAFIQPLLNAIPLPDWKGWQSDWQSSYSYLNLQETLNEYF